MIDVFDNFIFQRVNFIFPRNVGI